MYMVQGIAAAIENMLLTAHSLGLGSCWIGAFDEDEVRRLCNLPEHVDVHAVITIGLADETPEMPPKYRIEHTMFFERWWGRQEAPKGGLGEWSPVFKKAAEDTSKIAHKHGKSIVHKIKEKFKKKKI